MVDMQFKNIPLTLIIQNLLLLAQFLLYTRDRNDHAIPLPFFAFLLYLFHLWVGLGYKMDLG